MDGMLSQDEINALLSGMNTDSNSDEPEDASTDTGLMQDEEFVLLDSEKDAVGEISNISMGTAATTLSSLLNQKVSITTPKVSVVQWDDLAKDYDRPCVLLQISYKEGLDGSNVLVLKENDVKIITDIMMGGTGQVDVNEPLGELHLSAIGEAMNQMMGSAATSMSSMFKRKIDISPPIASLVELYGDSLENMPEFIDKPFVKVAFKMQISDLIDSEIMQLYPIAFAQELIGMFSTDETTTKTPEAVKTPPTAKKQASQMQQTPNMGQQMPNMGQQVPNMGQQMPNMGQQMPNMGQQVPNMGQQMPNMGQQMPNMGYAQPMYSPQSDVNVQPASFQPFSGDLISLSQKENIDLIMDVPLEVTVELGRSTKSIKDILEFAPGTIVELNKIAGESVDILVNGKFVAKGEVVVIEESFGVRIIEIIK